MMRIDVATAAASDGEGWWCDVTLTAADGSATRHRVRVRRVDVDRLDPGGTGPAELVRRSFSFLLAREPRESILRSFDLPVIGRYFPEYEREIRRAAR